jgi:ATP-dependent RNA helicase DDX35
MLADPLLTEYSVIVVDEAHERNNLTDVAMGLLKKIASKRDSLKIIISSATIDAELLKDFFNFPGKGKDTSVILTVEGRMFDAEILYLKEPCPDYIKETVSTIMKIHRKEKPGDILAFLTGQDEVHQAISLLREHLERTGLDEDSLKILPMHGSLTHHDQLKAFFGVPKGTRKVIIATNIAETSVTIPGIVYVIDCGFIKLKWFSADSMTESLVIVPVSKSSAKQRAGRAARLRSGKVYRLYTEEFYHSLPDFTPPEMRRSDLCMTVLQLKALGIDNVLRLVAFRPPKILSVFYNIFYKFSSKQIPLRVESPSQKSPR